MSKYILASVLALLLSISLSAQLTPQEAVEQMGRGINLGNTLDAPNYEGEWGRAAEEWYFDAYKEAGFSTVRIPITWNVRVGQQSPYAVDSVFFDRLDTIVNWALERDMFVIINTHHDSWYKEDYANPVNQARLDSIWAQTARRYKDMPEKLFFEMMNEPRTHEAEYLKTADIDAINARLLAIIREYNPTRIVVYSGKGWTSAGDMMAAAVPDDPYIMAYFHSYGPWSFAGEGEGTWGSASQRNSLYNEFANIASWAEGKGVKVLLGEFGAVNTCDYNSRMIHYATYVDACLKNGFAFTVWDDDGKFQVLKRADKGWQDSKDILTGWSLMSPDEIAVKDHNDSSFQVSWTLRSDLYDTLLVEKRPAGGEFQVIGGVHGEADRFVDSLPVIGQEADYRVIALTDTVKHYSYPVRATKMAWERFPYHGHSLPIPGSVEVEDYDIGGEMLTYHDLTPVNSLGDYRPDEGVDIKETSEGVFMVYAESGEWMKYSVRVEEEGEYLLSIPVATRKAGGKIRVWVGSRRTNFLDVPPTGSYTNTKNMEVRLHLDAGEQEMRMEFFGDAPFNIDRVEFTNVTSLENRQMASLRLYPNPAGDRLFVELEQEAFSACGTVYAMDGRKVLSQAFRGKQLELDLAELACGLYLVQVQSEEGTLHASFLKQ